MNVFVKEPSLDWFEIAQKNFQKSNAKYLMEKLSNDDESQSQASQQESQTQTQTQREASWYPEHKIYIAKLKLNCYKSTYVMLEEIHSTGHFSSKKLYNGMKLLINGFTNDQKPDGG